MVYQKHFALIALGALVLGSLLGGVGCSAKPTVEAPPETPAAVEAPAEAQAKKPMRTPAPVVVEKKVLGPEEPARDEDDAACRALLRENPKVREIMGDAPRLTFESQQTTPAGMISLYTAESQTRTVKLRVLWEKSGAELAVKGIDCQYRDGAAFMRAWSPTP